MKYLIHCLGLFVLILIHGCQKEVSFEVREDTSKYEFVSSSGSCATVAINGIWQTGRELDQSNLVVVPVSVEIKGTWSYLQSVNGITLSGSGNFSDTGLAVITLQASGVPQQEGSFDFVLSAATGCSLAITVDPSSGTNPGGSTNAVFYYKATIGGTYHEALCKENPTPPNDYLVGTGKGGLEHVALSTSISPMAHPVPAGFTSMEISKGILFDYLLATTSATVKNFFAPGSYSYITADSIGYPNASGISIIWTDTHGKLWSTEYGTGDQTGSTFTIVSIEDYDQPAFHTFKVKMQFACKLYKEDTGEMKQLTNGEMVGLVAWL